MATSTYGFPLTYPRFKAFTSSNAPGAGYALETYVAGSAVPLATYPTYADALAGTNANANPVIMNAQGEATIFGQGGQAYKLILKDGPGGATLWTVDAIVLTDVPKSQTTVIKNGNQLGMAAATKIVTWTVEVDALNEWSAVNNRWTATYAGKYCVWLKESMQDSAGAQVVTAFIYKNGGAVDGASTRTPAAAVGTTVNTFYTWIAAAGDTIEVYGQGSANTQVNTGTGTRLMIIGVA